MGHVDKGLMVLQVPLKGAAPTLEMGTQTSLGTGASALVAAARDEIVRLRQLNQRLLDVKAGTFTSAYVVLV